MEKIPGQSALTFAYPNCIPGDYAITQTYYIAARGCNGTGLEPSTPANLFNVASVVVGSEGPIKTAADFNRKAAEAAGSNRWAIFLIHGIDDDGGWSPVASSELRAHLEYLDANRDRFWVETFGNVVRYIRERNAASVSEVSAAEDEIVVQVSDTLDDAVYNHPLTIRRALPQGWEAVSATQGGAPIPAEIVEAGGERFVQFDAVPDAGRVVLTRRSGTGVDTGDAGIPASAHPVTNYPNPFQSTTTLAYHVGPDR